MIQTLQTHRSPRLLAWALTLLLCGPVVAGLSGCGSKNDAPQTTVSNASPAPDVTTAPGGSTMSSTPHAPAAKPGMSASKKAVIVLAGAALLYYLYKKHQATQQAQVAASSTAGSMPGGASPQLYRSSNGGVYYRDPQNPQKVTWLTAPAQPVSVSADEVQQYAPDYGQYQGQPAPPVPAGQPSRSFSQYDPSLAQN